MCLAVPGKIVKIEEKGENPGIGESGIVDFQGNRVEVSLAMVPEAKVWDWLLVHAGFALNILEEQEARETWDYLKEAGVLPGLTGGLD